MSVGRRSRFQAVSATADEGPNFCTLQERAEQQHRSDGDNAVVDERCGSEHRHRHAGESDPQAEAPGALAAALVEIRGHRFGLHDILLPPYAAGRFASIAAFACRYLLSPEVFSSLNF